jgi:hypothetical protein
VFERFTIEREPPCHYCRACAENVPAVITALQLAYDQELLLIVQDERVTDEICAYCQRAIATVLAPQVSIRHPRHSGKPDCGRMRVPRGCLPYASSRS